MNREDLKSFAGFLAAIAAIALLVAALITGGIRWQCAAYERNTGHETRTDAWTCYVKGSLRWYAWEEWKLRGAANGY